MAFRQIKSPALANQAVIDTKLDASSVSGQTATTSASNLDAFLLHENATSSLKSISAADFISSFTTDDIAEGSTNEYFTDTKAQTAVAADIATAVAAEATIARAAELQNANDIAAEITRATAAEGVNATDIAGEITRATAAESALDTAYKAADAGLQTQITNIISNVDPAALDSLSEIVAEFQSQDSALTAAITANSTLITNETARAQAAEGVNATAISDEATRAQTAEATNAADIVSEAATARAAENALDARVTVNEGDVATLQTGLAAEISTTDGEISTLQGDLASEITRAQGAELANAQDIAAEATARANADTAVRTDFATADATTLASANTYADTAEADAIATAAADATTKADAAQAAAIAHADTVSAAETAAINTAVGVVDAKVTTAEAAISDLETVVGDLDDTPLDTTAGDIGGAINELHGEIDSAVADIATAQGDITTNAGNIATQTGRIDDILTNTDPAALDSLTEIVTAFQAGDNAATAAINANATALASEETDRISGDATLQTAINTESTRAQAAEGQNASDIASEITNRQAGDASTLASAQAYADTSEADAISTAAADATTKADAAEADAKTHADTQDAALIGDGTVDGTAGNTVTDRIDTAEADAIATAAADATAKVATETTRAQAAEAANTLAITANTGDIATNAGDIATNATAIASETADRIAADATLTTAISDEETRAQAAELVNSQAISAEETRALAAEGANATAISNEVTRSTAADATHTANIATNTNDIATNLTAINNEVTRAGAAEATLQSNIDVETARIDSILTNTDPAALDSLTEIVTAFQDADNTINGAITSLSGTASTDRAAIRSEFAAADSALDTRLSAEEGKVSALETLAGSASLDTTAQTLTEAINELNTGTSADFSTVNGNIDAVETGAGLNADGSYNPDPAANFIATAPSIHGATQLLDAAIKSEESRAQAAEATLTGNVSANATAIANNATDIETAQDDIIDNATNIAANAAAITAEATTARAAEQANANAITAEATTARAAEQANAASITAESTRAQAAEAANATDIASNLTEITATQAGAGLGTDGTYSANTTANHIPTASSLVDADNKLDAAIAAETTRATAAETVLTNDLSTEVTRAQTAEQANAADIATEAARAQAAEVVNANAITTVAGDLATEVTRTDALVVTVNDIISNTDPAALDSLSEIVTAFQAADSTLTGTVAANATDIANLSTALTAEVNANDADHASATTDRAAIRSEFAAADSAQDTVIATKLPKAGGTMSGDIAMGGQLVTGLGTAANPGDAVSKAVLDAAISAQDISTNTTDDLAEGSNLYYLDSRARAAISVNDVAGAGLVSYDNTTGVISVDTNESVLDLTDVSDTDYTSKDGYVLAVNSTEDGMELKNPLNVFSTQERQTINGDGAATQYSLTFTTTQDQAMVFVGGVIQDPSTHYTIDSGAKTITFNSAVPVGTQIVVLSPGAGLNPVLLANSVSFDKLAADIKAYVQKGEVSASGTTTVDTFNGALYRTAKYIMQVEDGAGNYESREALVVHDGTNAYISEYAIVYTGADLIGDASVAVDGNNINLTYTPTSGTATVKVIATYIDV